MRGRFVFATEDCKLDLETDDVEWFIGYIWNSKVG